MAATWRSERIRMIAGFNHTSFTVPDLERAVVSGARRWASAAARLQSAPALGREGHWRGGRTDQVIRFARLASPREVDLTTSLGKIKRRRWGRSLRHQQMLSWPAGAGTTAWSRAGAPTRLGNRHLPRRNEPTGSRSPGGWRAQSGPASPSARGSAWVPSAQGDQQRRNVLLEVDGPPGSSASRESPARLRGGT
jgi:hypothetical protein